MLSGQDIPSGVAPQQSSGPLTWPLKLNIINLTSKLFLALRIDLYTNFSMVVHKWQLILALSKNVTTYFSTSQFLSGIAQWDNMR